MKRELFSTAAILTVIASLSGSIATDAHAIGFGMTVGATTGKFHPDSNSETGNSSFSEHKESIGLIFDTNINKTDLFNYRLGISYERVTVNLPETESYDGVTVENDFGFGFSTDSYRLWLGPEVRANYNSRYLLGIGVGPALGINVNLDNSMALCARGSYIYSRHERFFSESGERSASVNLGIVMKLGTERLTPPQPATQPVH